MKYKEFTDKKNAIEFAKENGGYYEIVVDDRANNIYIVFYRWPGCEVEIYGFWNKTELDWFCPWTVRCCFGKWRNTSIKSASQLAVHGNSKK